MYSARTRLTASIIAFVLGILLIRAGSTGGWLLFAVPPLLYWGKQRSGPMVLAFHAYSAGDLTRMRQLLAEVRAPDRLRAQERAYFEFLTGVDAQDRHDYFRAIEHFRAALRGPLRTANMVGIAHLHLAEVSSAAGDPVAAQESLAAAREKVHRQPTIALLRQVEARIAAAKNPEQQAACGREPFPE